MEIMSVVLKYSMLLETDFVKGISTFLHWFLLESSARFLLIPDSDWLFFSKGFDFDFEDLIL